MTASVPAGGTAAHAALLLALIEDLEGDDPGSLPDTRCALDALLARLEAETRRADEAENKLGTTGWEFVPDRREPGGGYWVPPKVPTRFQP